MFSIFLQGLKKFDPAIYIGVIFFIIPFFWLKPGEIDLGGDGTRLYFYDPIAFLKNISIYSLEPIGKANVDSTKHAYLIYVSLLAFLKYFINSSYFLISIFNGIKLSIGFISIYYIVTELIFSNKQPGKKSINIQLAAIISGCFYVFATGSENLIFFWRTALHSHDQVFLNPLMFLLLMKFLLTEKKSYLYSALFLSFFFSTNFSMISSPAFFAFYPLSILFLLLYVVFIRKRKLPLINLLIGGCIFLGLQAFHLLPEISGLFHIGSSTNSLVFKETLSAGVNFFIALRDFGKASINLLLPSPEVSLRFLSFIPPSIILCGFLLQKKIKKEIVLTSVFFLITAFFVTANITNFGYEVYKTLFYIPGFAMFRHFYTQWGYVFIFFYSLLFGQTFFVILEKLKPKYGKIFFFIVLLSLFVSFWSFLNGKFFTTTHWGSKNVKTTVVMDPRYEQTLEFIRKLSDDGKILVFPLTSYYHQIIFGLNNGAYVGPSSISFLTHKRSFDGYQNFDSYPYIVSENILQLAREKNYNALMQIFSLFNIRYIYHNTDPRVYEEKFSQFPNDYMMTAFPKTQKEYKEFVKKLPVHMIYKNGPYEIFEVDKKVYRPEIYIPNRLYKDDMLQVIKEQNVSYQSAFIDEKICQENNMIYEFCRKKYTPPQTRINTKKITPTNYLIQIKQVPSESPFVLVFQNSFNTDWNVSINKRVLVEERHIVINRYANGWIITPEDHKEKNNYTISLSLRTQDYFWYGLYITGFTLLILITLTITGVFNRNHAK